MEYRELTEQIIGCAYRVYNKMGFGLLESIYEKCMLIELCKCGLKDEKIKVRLFAIKAPEEVAAERRRKLNQNAEKKGRTPKLK